MPCRRLLKNYGMKNCESFCWLARREEGREQLPDRIGMKPANNGRGHGSSAGRPHRGVGREATRIKRAAAHTRQGKKPKDGLKAR